MAWVRQAHRSNPRGCNVRQLFEEVVEGTRDALLDWHTEMARYSGLTDEEAMRRYATRHRGNPQAILNYTQANMPDGADALDAAVEYERTMEEMLRRNQRRNHAA